MNRAAILDSVRSYSRPDRPVYLVGGAVRDQLLNRPGHDLDFVLPGETLSTARAVADRLKGGLYVMDETRGITRVVLNQGSSERILLDFATLRHENLAGDLADRDFTINAMAYDLSQPERLIDPTGGLADLRDQRLRTCSAASLTDDPVRVLRAVRLSLALRLQILPETIRQMRAGAALLPQVSSERVRDEIFRSLSGPKVHMAVRVLDQVGAWSQILPEWADLKGQALDQAGIYDAWEHTLNTVRYLEQLLAPLVGAYREETVADLMTGSAVLWLGRYRSQLEQHYQTEYVPERSLRSLAFLAALYLDLSRQAKDRAGNGQGAALLAWRAQQLALSAQEINHLKLVLQNSFRIRVMAERGIKNTQLPEARRAIYQFFKETSRAGVDVCLISLADLRAIHGVALPQDRWQAELETCRAVLEAYWEKRDEIVSPPRLLSGEDLMRELGLKPGRMVGALLEIIAEAQVAGEIATAAQAMALAKQQLDGRLREAGL